jgi:RNA polymerase-binding transcription factor DksA
MDTASPAVTKRVTVLCCDCGEPVAPERLAAVPGAECCTDCQAAREARGAIGRAPGAGRWAA